MNSFIPALIEETHSELYSGLISVSQAPFCEISTIEPSRDFNPPMGLFYKSKLKSTTEDVQAVRKYVPEVGDIFAFTTIRPRSVDDLNMPENYYHIAYVERKKDEYTDEISILSSNDMELDAKTDFSSNKAQKLYAVFLMNMTTNVRIWKALHHELEAANMNLVWEVVQADAKVRITKSIYS